VRRTSAPSRYPVRIAVVLRPATDPQAARDRLAAFPGITTESPAGYPGPLAALLRGWTRQHQHEDIAGSLAALEEAIRRDREPSRSVCHHGASARVH
jgi:hypothetical protein